MIKINLNNILKWSGWLIRIPYTDYITLPKLYEKNQIMLLIYNYLNTKYLNNKFKL